jgi:hypothetical protein
MVTCQNCGLEARSGTNFCPKCGAALDAAVPPARGRQGMSDYLDLVSVGVILVLIAVTFIRYPINPSSISNYFKNMVSQKAFLKPPSTILDAGVFFLYAAGIWGVILSGLRSILMRSLKKFQGDLTGGLFSLFLAFLLANYAVDILSENTLLAYIIIVIGCLVIINSIVSIFFTRRKLSKS